MNGELNIKKISFGEPLFTITKVNNTPDFKFKGKYIIEKRKVFFALKELKISESIVLESQIPLTTNKDRHDFANMCKWVFDSVTKQLIDY